jgi:prepilin-type N-terminal cleavage/methylation domain-containing protein
MEIFKQTMFYKHLILPKALRSKSRSSQGFTLLEVMISLAIIAIALLAVYGNYSQTIAMSTDQRFNTTAPLLAARVAADFENRSLDELVDESGNFGPAFDGYEWVVTVEPVSSEILGKMAEDLHHIDITVSFSSDAYVFHCSTVRFIRREDGS